MKNKKRLLVLILMLLSILSGCAKKDKPLTVYVVETEALYKQSVEAFSEEYPDLELNIVLFDSYEKMEEQMSVELLSGKGPDVLLFNGKTGTADPYKLASGGSLLVLDEMMEGLSDDEYFGQILEAGSINGHQYFIPLSWNILQAYSSRDKMDEKGYGDDLYQALIDDHFALEGDGEHCPSTLQFGRSDMLNYLMEVAGQEVIDYESGQLVMQKEEILETSEFLKYFVDGRPVRRELLEITRNDFAMSAELFTYFLEDFSFMNNVRYYQSVFPYLVEEEMYFAPFTERDGEGINAQIVQYGAINAQTENKEAARDLLCYILNTVPETQAFSKYESESVYYTPVSVIAYQACLDDLSSTLGIGVNGKPVAALNEENLKILQELPSKVTGAVIPNPALGTILQECINPYLNGEDSFDNCYEELLQRVKLYLGE